MYSRIRQVLLHRNSQHSKNYSRYFLPPIALVSTALVYADSGDPEHKDIAEKQLPSERFAFYGVPNTSLHNTIRNTMGTAPDAMRWNSFLRVAIPLFSDEFRDVDLFSCIVSCIALSKWQANSNIFEQLPGDTYMSSNVLFEDELKSVYHFCRIATACYGWAGRAYFDLMDPRQALGSNTLSALGKAFFGPQGKLSFSQLADVPPESVIYEAEAPGIGIPHHWILVDEQTKSIVVTIRGTMSLDDCATDLLVDLQPFCNGYAHEGMMSAAEKIFYRIEGILEAELEKRRGEGYKLVLTGHSLGGGTCSLLYLLLHWNREKRRFSRKKEYEELIKAHLLEKWKSALHFSHTDGLMQPSFDLDILDLDSRKPSVLDLVDIECYTFGTPPTFFPLHPLPKHVSKGLKNWVHGQDVISRLSIQSVRSLIQTCRVISAIYPSTFSRIFTVPDLSEVLDESGRLLPEYTAPLSSDSEANSQSLPAQASLPVHAPAQLHSGDVIARNKPQSLPVLISTRRNLNASEQPLLKYFRMPNELEVQQQGSSAPSITKELLSRLENILEDLHANKASLTEKYEHLMEFFPTFLKSMQRVNRQDLLQNWETVVYPAIQQSLRLFDTKDDSNSWITEAHGRESGAIPAATIEISPKSGIELQIPGTIYCFKSLVEEEEFDLISEGTEYDDGVLPQSRPKRDLNYGEASTTTKTLLIKSTDVTPSPQKKQLPNFLCTGESGNPNLDSLRASTPPLVVRRVNFRPTEMIVHASGAIGASQVPAPCRDGNNEEPVTVANVKQPGYLPSVSSLTFLLQALQNTPVKLTETSKSVGLELSNFLWNIANKTTTIAYSGSLIEDSSRNSDEMSQLASVSSEELDSSNLSEHRISPPELQRRNGGFHPSPYETEKGETIGEVQSLARRRADTTDQPLVTKTNFQNLGPLPLTVRAWRHHVPDQYLFGLRMLYEIAYDRRRELE